MEKRGNHLEYAPIEEVQAYQNRALAQQVAYVYERSPFYRDLWQSQGLRPEDVQCVEDLACLPCTDKPDLQQRNWDFCCVPREEVAEIVCTSGTTGEPIYLALTPQDLDRLARNEELSFLCADTTPEDVFQLMVTLDHLFMAGLAYFLGITRLGATAIRAGTGNTRWQLKLLRELQPTGIVGVPSYLLTLHQTAEEEGFDRSAPALRKALLIGQTIRLPDFRLNGLGQRIQELWDIELFSTYGVTEMATSFCECRAHQGSHGHPELLLFEIVDEAGKPLPEGEVGELVVTPLHTQGMPLLRYRTGDITFRISEPCSCGRTCSRIGPIIGRRANKMKVKGTTIYPGNLEQALMEIREVETFVIEAFRGDDYGDRVQVKVGTQVPDPARLKARILAGMRAHARLTPEVEIWSPAEVEALACPPGERKPRRFIDHRQDSI